MRWTFGTVVTSGLLLFVALAYWPAGENGPGPLVVVGEPQTETTGLENNPGPLVVSSFVTNRMDPNEQAFQSLLQPITMDANMTVQQLLHEIAAQAGVELDQQLPADGAGDALGQLKKEVSIKLDAAPALVALRTAAQDKLGFTLRDGRLMIVSRDEEEMSGFMLVYGVSDLLAVQEDEAVNIRRSGYSQLRHLVNERRRLLLNAKADEARGYDEAVVVAAEALVQETETARHGLPKLVRTIQEVVNPPDWDINGGPHSIQSYGNALIVFASLSTHWEITQTLDRLRRHAIPRVSKETVAQHSPTAKPYVIEPPDVLLIQAKKVVPKSPYKLQPFDNVVVRIPDGPGGNPIIEEFAIQPDGTLDLGLGYGKVKIVDQTIEEAHQAVEDHLKQFLRDPQISLALASAAGLDAIDGQFLVAPDGRVNLGNYGQVYVAGKTLAEAKAAIEEKLGEKLQDPEVVVDVSAYNSKVYYVITQGDGAGDNVVRVPITGNETVLDAVANVERLSLVSDSRIWISRPAPNGAGRAQTLPIDWSGITQDSDTATNYRILPGDRIFIDAQNSEAHDGQIPPEVIR